MGLKIRVRQEGDEHVAVIRDSEHAGVEAAFTYSLVENTVSLIGVTVQLRARTKNRRALTITEVRDLPMARWEQAARGHAAAAFNAAFRKGMARTMRQMSDREIIARVQPELLEDANARPNDGRVQRSLNAAKRLVRVAQLYRECVHAGVPNPADTIAERFNVSPSTARALIFRARKKGYLGPATGTTTGEQMQLEPSNKRRGKRRRT